jgi:peptidoglycan/xylan/chitin deacetylase (PgdA/CDA1 family)
MKRIFFFCFGLVCLVLVASCRKDVPKGNIPNGEIAVTFDDYNIDNWYKHLHLLDSLDIKATFYVCRYHLLSAKQKQELREIASHGHEIAYHTTSHLDLAKTYEKKGLAWIIQNEIHKDLEAMRKDGYAATDFAYPYGSHNPQLDAALLRLFKSIRALGNKQDWNKSLVKRSGDKQIFYGAGIDQNSKLTDGGIYTLLKDAHDFHDCLVLTGHEINNPNYPLHVTLSRLKMISDQAKRMNLKFVTISEICTQ